METTWDHMLMDDMRREATTIKLIDFKFNTAATTEQQIRQIESAIARKVNAIIVNPYDESSLVPVIEKAYDSGVYVVIVGQKPSTFKYHSYVGLNSNLLGLNSAKYVCEQLNDKGNIVLLESFRDAPFYHDRYNSFIQVINNHKNVNIVGRVDANWNKQLAHQGIDSLKTVLKDTKVDLVYSFGDMVIGALETGAFPEAIYIGNDGVPGECLQAVKSGSLKATFYNPTGGKEALDAAVSIVKGMQYSKENYLSPMLVDAYNIDLIESNLTSLMNYKNKIDILSDELVQDHYQLSRLKRLSTIFICFAILFAIIIIIDCIKGIRNNKITKELKWKANQFEEQFNEMAIQKEIAERMRWHLESDRDALIEASMQGNDQSPIDVIADKVFMNEFRRVVENSIDNPDLTIDDIASELNVSRAQLFRKLKINSGSTPNELLHAIRLEKAKQLLLEGVMNVSEVVYAVGFSSPSYFTKCFKDKFGILPSEIHGQKSSARQS